MAKFLSSVLYGIVWVFSLLPMPILYLFSDIMWLVMFLCPPLRYRKKVVQKNLAMAFPDKDRKWLRRTERRFYYQFSCQIMESLKTASVGGGTERPFRIRISGTCRQLGVDTFHDALFQGRERFYRWTGLPQA